MKRDAFAAGILSYPAIRLLWVTRLGGVGRVVKLGHGIAIYLLAVLVPIQEAHFFAAR